MAPGGASAGTGPGEPGGWPASAGTGPGEAGGWPASAGTAPGHATPRGWRVLTAWGSWSRRTRILAAAAAVVVVAAGVTGGLVATRSGHAASPVAAGSSARPGTGGGNGTGSGSLPSAPQSPVSGWQPEEYVNGPPGASGDSDWEITAIACLPGGACALGDNAGDVAAPQQYFAGGTSAKATTWSNIDANSGSPTIFSLTCASETFCMAADENSDLLTYQGGTWTGPANVDSDGEVEAVDCPTTSFCMLVDNGGNALTWSSSSHSWSQPDQIDPNGLLGGGMGLSCVSASFCVAVDSNGDDFLYNGTTWTAGPAISLGEVAGISCASPTFCVVTSGSAEAESYNGSSWTALTLPINADLISCAQPGDCMAADSSTGNTAIDQNSTWTQPPSANFGAGSGFDNNVLTNLDCWSAQACIAVDGANEIWRYQA